MSQAVEVAKPVVRHSAKILLVDTAGRVLLFRGVDPGRPRAGSWWFPAGGGLEPGESHEDAARRELFEETGLEVHRLGVVVLERSVRLEFDGIDYQGEEQYFLVRTSPFEIATDRWTEVERRVGLEHRWWTRVELRTTTDTVYPEGLAGLLDELDGRTR
jgi:8-oxo-dGTP pyrophosphatase MutT (NUDIX family)